MTDAAVGADPVRRRIRLLALGGTIAAPVGEGRSGFGIDAEQLIAAVPAIADAADVTGGTFLATASASLAFDDITALAAEIDRVVAAGAEGVVVTQGTDTLEETAFLLDLLLDVQVPVVVTGAMRNAGLPGEDGPANLLGAVRVAAHPDAAGLGVLVVLHDEVHLARWVRKTHTSSVGAFTSAPLGPIGWLVEDRVRLVLAPRRGRRPALVPTAGAPSPRVALVRLALGDDGGLVGALAGLGVDGVVVEAFGAGHVPAGQVDVLRDLAARLPVVFASRTGGGELYRATGRFPGSERDLLDAGLIPAGALDGAKARVLLVACLWAGLDAAGIRERVAADLG